MLHGEFEVVRDFSAPLVEVWSAYADPELRHRWHRIPSRDSRLALDFRTDGLEILTGSFAASGDIELIDSRRRFLDIATHRRIVSSHVFVHNGVRRWVSLVALAFEHLADGSTRLRHHEQYTFLRWTGDGCHDVAHLRGSVNLAFNALNAALDASADAPSSQ